MSLSVIVPMLTALAAAGGPTAPARAAIAEPVYRVERVEVVGDPVRVAMTLSREMRTAGWDLRVETVDVAPSDRRVVVRMEAIPPDGPAAQVISRRDVRVDLGPLAPGRYVVEIRERPDGAGAPEPVQAEVLVVAGSGGAAAPR